MAKKELNLGDKIKSAIKQSGKSRKEIAYEMAISEANIYKLYKSSDTKVMTLIKLAEVTDLPLTYFLDIEESEQVKELREKLDKERINNKLSVMLLKNQHYFMLQIFEMMAEMEDFFNNKVTLTLITPEETKKIPLSRFLKLVYKFSKLVMDESKEEEIFKLINVLFNIVEFRKLILYDTDESVMIPDELKQFIQNNILTTPCKVNEYIDFRKHLNE